MPILPSIPPAIEWAGYIVLILVLLFIDLNSFKKRQHELTVAEALRWTGIWIFASLLFNLFIYLEFGPVKAVQYFTGYVVEKSLSVDNLFVILLIFTSFKIEPKYQHKLLYWGILGAIIMRGVLIVVGSFLISRFHWILYLFGIFLVYTGAKIFLGKEEERDPHDSFVVRLLRRFVHISRSQEGGNFFVKDGKRTAITILFVTILVIEVTDVAFAFDSIPAIFGITTDPFIVFTSNIFAVLGLRSLYFVVHRAHSKFVYLPMGLAVILIFIGLKMLIEPFVEISILTSLGVIAAVLFIYILASLYMLPKKKKIVAR